MNVETGTEAALFPENKYINGIFLAVYFKGSLTATRAHGNGKTCDPYL
jgi:hypothetical protein